MILDDLNATAYDRLEKRVRKLEASAGTSSASVTRGMFRIASIDGLVVEGQQRVTGILVVDGSLQVTGVETVSGTLIISGGQIINGTFIINGTTTINGATTFVGDVDVTGAFQLTGTMTVTGGGKILVDGAIPLEIVDGRITFNNGAYIQGDSGGAKLAAGSGQLLVSDTVATLVAGSTVLAVLGSGQVVATGGLVVTEDVEIAGALSANLPFSASTTLKDVKFDPSTGAFFYVP